MHRVCWRGHTCFPHGWQGSPRWTRVSGVLNDRVIEGSIEPKRETTGLLKAIPMWRGPLSVDTTKSDRSITALLKPKGSDSHRPILRMRSERHWSSIALATSRSAGPQ